MQAALINRFKRGDLNTLVATCVAEEGLDIGDVNLIISYDCLSSPVRMVQRFGRTGRAGVGKIIVLIQRGEEENKYKQSKMNSRKIMDSIKEASKPSKLPESTLNQPGGVGQSLLKFGQPKTYTSAFDDINEKRDQTKSLVFYGFNSRMVPERIITIKPVYRTLQPRTLKELELLEAIKKKKEKQNRRKSKSATNSPRSKEELLDDQNPKKKGKGKKKKGKKSEADRGDNEDNEQASSIEDVDKEEIEHINKVLRLSTSHHYIEQVRNSLLAFTPS